MLSSYFSLNTVAELICLIVSAFCLARDKTLAWRLMIILLLATYFGETFARFIYMSGLAKSNHWVYNVLIIFQAGVMITMFTHLFRQYNVSVWLIYAGLLLMSVNYGYDLYNNTFLTFSQNTYSLLNLLIVIYSFIYYYHLLTDNRYIDLKIFPEFWWVTGIMFFCIGSAVCNIFNEKLATTIISGHHLGYYVFRLLNIILYGFWSFSFICRRWLYKPEASAAINAGTL